MGGAFLIALSTFQGEFDYAVPQFRLDWHPILLMMAAGIGLVTARIAIGKGGALGAALFFILIRGLLSLWVGPITGHTTLHFPLYLAEALVVEASPEVPRASRSAWASTRASASARSAWPPSGSGRTSGGSCPGPGRCCPRPRSPASSSAVAGGVIGGFIGRALIARRGSSRSPARACSSGRAAAMVAVFIYAGRSAIAATR